jgi:hypothetical protein
MNDWTSKIAFHVPTRPYSPIDALNRRALAIGGVRNAMAGAHADYNGHNVTVEWNSYRNYYVARYMWAGPVVIGRGSFAECLRAALREFDKGAVGASVEITLREGDEEAKALCEAEPKLVAGSPWASDDKGNVRHHLGDWYTWRHDTAAACARDAACRNYPFIFDWELLQAAENEDDYCNRLKAKHGRVYQ